jgi:ABC-2 type transport system permease protein
MLRVTLRQVVGGPRWLAFALLALLPSVVMWFASMNLTAEATFDRFHDAPLPTLLLIVVPVVTLVVASGALGDERRDATLSFLLVRPVRRSTIVAAKLAASWLAAVAVVGVAGAMAAGVLALRAGTWVTLAPTLVAVAVSSAGYAAVFVVLGYLTSRAVLVGLVYVFVWESGISLAVPTLATVSLSRIGLTAYVGLLPRSAGMLDEPLGNLAPGVGGASVKAIGISVVALMVGSWMLRRRDATPE